MASSLFPWLVFLSLVLASVPRVTDAIDVSPTTSGVLPSCPAQCTCSSSLTCRNLGEQTRVMDFSAVVGSMPFSLVTFAGRTKIRTVQAQAFSGLRTQRLRLDGLGVRSVERGALLGVAGLLHVELDRNHISGTLEAGAFAVDGALNSLDVSSNDIEAVAEDALSSVGGSSMKDLRLADNRLFTLPGRVFANLTGLQHLDLRGNRLSNLSRPLFDDLGDLRRLYLSGNRISYIDPSVLSSLTYLDRLEMDNNQLSSLSASLFTRLPSLRILSVQGNRLSAVHSSAFPLEGSLTTLRLNRNGFDDLTQIQLSGIGKNLRTLSLAGNRLTTIPAQYFVGFRDLNDLDLSRNNISNWLNESSFEGLQSLQLLNLSNNNIKQVRTRTFGSSLRVLDLSNNDYLTILDSGAFDNATSLRVLYLRHNGLELIFRGKFRRIPQLEVLDLSDNIIRNLYRSSFEDLPSLRRVDLSRNNIDSLPANVFLNTSRLANVILDENRLSVMPHDTLNDLPNVLNFSLAYNNIGKLHQVLRSPTIELLNLTGNEISDIVARAFNLTPQVRELYLGQNLLTAVRNETFSGLALLAHLDLSDNLIATIDVGSFLTLLNLRELNLHGNRLTIIDPGVFNGLFSLNSLILGANRLVTVDTDQLQNLFSLRELILDDNDINSFRYVNSANREAGLNRLSLRRNNISSLLINTDFPMTYLDLGDNRLTSGIFKIIQRLQYLRTLKLDNNAIWTVPTGSFWSNMTLTELDLSNNGLTDASLPAIVQLRQLRQLRLDGNSIQNLSTANWSLLANSLTALSVSNNRLTSIEEITNLWSVTQLNVDNNLIEVIPDAVFRPLYDLEVVSVRGNLLTGVGRSALDGLEQKCAQLDLSANHITSVHAEAFNRLKKIERLNISNNAINELVLPPIMNHLTELVLDHNQLTRFPDGPHSFPSMYVLNMSHNIINNLPPLDIGNKFGVGLVDLSDNHLRNVHSLRLAGSLNVVDFSNNNLSDIGSGVLNGTTFIRELKLSRNPLGRLPDAVTYAAAHIARLVADRCSMTSLDNWGLAAWSSTRLVELSLVGNRLTVLPPTVVLSVGRSLEQLDVRGNLLSTLDNALYDGPWTPLRRLTLAGNPWRCDCQLAWLRRQRHSVEIDNATCWAPSTTADQLVVCYNISACDALPQNEEYKEIDYDDDYVNEDNYVCEVTKPADPVVVVSSVWPLYGPEAGGTVITITGSNFGDSKEPVIVLASSSLDNFITLPTNTTVSSSKRSLITTVVGKTPTSNRIGEELLVAVQYVDRPLVNTTKYFVYRRNPDVIDIFPLTHLLRLAPNTGKARLPTITSLKDGTTSWSELDERRRRRDGRSETGGTMVTVTGNYLDAAVEPVLTITVAVTRRNPQQHHSNSSSSSSDDPTPTVNQTQVTCTSEVCAVKNSSFMTCMMPEVELPDDFDVDDADDDQRAPAAAGGGVTSLMGGPDDLDRADLYVGLLFDGFEDYGNLTAAIPDIQFQFFQHPTIESSVRVIVYRPQSFSDIDITGEDLQRGTRITDYLVVIGNGFCNVSSLSDNLLTCRPPFDEPQLAADDSFCNGVNSILVNAGNAGPFLYACIKYEADDELNVPLIVGLVVGLGGLLLVVVLVVLCVYVHRRRNNDKPIDDSITERTQPSTVVVHHAECMNPMFLRSTENKQPLSTALKDHHSVPRDGPETPPSYVDQLPGPTFSGNGGVVKQPENTVSGYIQPITDEQYFAQPAAEDTDDNGYLIPTDLSSSPDPEETLCYMVPLPSPTSSPNRDHQHPQNSPNGYIQPITDEHYFAHSAAATTDDNGYLITTQDSPSAETSPSYIVLLPSPTSSRNGNVEQPSTVETGADSHHPMPFEAGESRHYMDMSVPLRDTAPHRGHITLQLDGHTVGTSNTDSDRISSELSDDGYVSPFIRRVV